MFFVPAVGKIVGVCQKAASSSLANQFHVPGLNEITELAVIELKKSGWDAVGIIRDPIDRLESAWNFFKYGQNNHEYVRPFETIEQFVDALLRGVKNPHWDQQVSQLAVCNRFVRLEDFPLTVCENSCDHQDVIAHRVNELRMFYAGDFAARGVSWR